MTQVSWQYIEKKFDTQIADTWKLLKSNKSDSLVFRRIRNLGYGCFLGYWSEGNKEPTIIINFKGSIKIDNSQFKNLSFTQKTISQGKSRLMITPKKKNYFKVFEKYLPLFFINENKDLLNSTQLKILLRDVTDFSKLITNKKKRMTNEQIKGLYGELLFIKNTCDEKKMKLIDLIEGWQKSGNKHNDFIFKNEEYEIKTTEQTKDISVNISSEFQLHSFNRSKVFMCVKQIKKHKKGLTLDQLISKVKSLFAKDSLALIKFTKKMLAYGYISSENTKKVQFHEIKTDLYEIDHTFPKLTLDHIPRQTHDLKYKINLKNIKR